MLWSISSRWFVRREVTPQSFRLLITLLYPNNIWCFRLVLTLFGLYIHHIDMHRWFEKCKHKCKSWCSSPASEDCETVLFRLFSHLCIWVTATDGYISGLTEPHQALVQIACVSPLRISGWFLFFSLHMYIFLILWTNISIDSTFCLCWFLKKDIVKYKAM